MSKAFKAVLLSALVFPGVGHFALKKPLQGTLLSGASFVCLYFLLTAVMDIAEQLAIKIQSGDIPLDVSTLSGLITGQLAGNDSGLINISLLMLVIFWIVGIADSFRLGWSQDQSDVGAGKKT